MIGALKYESVRIRTIASSYWLSGLALILTSAIALLGAISISSNDFDDWELTEVTTWVITGGASALFMPVLAAVFFAVIGAMAMGHEYRYGTNKATLSAIPDRFAVLAAKAAILSLWVAAITLATVLVNMLVGWLFMGSFNLGTETIRPVVNYILYNVGFALTGMGLAMVFRNQVGAIVTVLVWPLVIEPIVMGIVRAVGSATEAGLGRIGNLLPASAGRRTMFSPYELQAGLDGAFDVWGLEASTVVFWLGVLAVFVAGSALFISRDA